MKIKIESKKLSLFQLTVLFQPIVLLKLQARNLTILKICRLPYCT